MNGSQKDYYKHIEIYKEFELNGRFIPRRQTGRMASFHVEALGPQDFEFEQVVLSPLGDINKLSTKKAQRLMKEHAVTLTKRRIDNNDFEKGEIYEKRFIFRS